MISETLQAGRAARETSGYEFLSTVYGYWIATNFPHALPESPFEYSILQSSLAARIPATTVLSFRSSLKGMFVTTAPWVSAPSATTAPTIDGRSLRSYEPNALSKSRLGVFQRCQRRYYIEYERGMERIGDDNENLRMGAAFALALEHNDVKKPWADVYAPLLEQAEHQGAVDAVMIESATVEYYASKYIEIFGECDYREQEYEFEIPGTNFTFRGAVDGMNMLPSISPSACRPVEDKLLGQWTESQVKNLSLDNQLRGEVFGLREAGFDTNTIDFRVVLKSGIRRLKGRGKNPVPEPVSDFIMRLMETVEKDIEKHFIPHTVVISDADLADFISDMQDYSAQIEQARERGRFPKSKDTCSYRGGCAHREVCCGVASAVGLYKVKDGYPGSEVKTNG